MLNNFKDLCFRNKFKFDIFLGEILYKNRVGFHLNKLGLDRWKANEKYSNDNKRHFPLGYHFLEISNKKALQEIKEKYEKIIFENKDNLYKGKEGDPKSFFMIKNILKEVPSVLEILTPDVLEKIYQYYGAHFKISHVSAYRTKHITHPETSREVYAYKLHYDRHPVDTLKLFVALSDITIKDGPLSFFDKNFSRTLLKKGYKERDDYGNAENLINESEKKKTFIGKMGSAVICDTATCLHMAGIPEKNCQRDILIFEFQSSSIKLDISSQETKNDISRAIEEENKRY